MVCRAVITAIIIAGGLWYMGLLDVPDYYSDNDFSNDISVLKSAHNSDDNTGYTSNEGHRAEA